MAVASALCPVVGMHSSQSMPRMSPAGLRGCHRQIDPSGERPIGIGRTTHAPCAHARHLVGVRRLWEVVARANRYVEETAPWTLARARAGVGEAETSLYSGPDRGPRTAGGGGGRRAGGSGNGVTAEEAMTALAAMATAAAESPAVDRRPRERDRLVVLGGRSHPAFVAAICRHLDHPVGRARLRTFSDGAIEVRMEENVRGRDVFVVQSGEATSERSRGGDALPGRRRSAGQRSQGDGGTPVLSLRQGGQEGQVAGLDSGPSRGGYARSGGAARVLTMDLHAGQIQGFFRVPVDNLYAFPVLVGRAGARPGLGRWSNAGDRGPEAGRALARDFRLRLASIGAGVAIGDKIARGTTSTRR